MYTREPEDEWRMRSPWPADMKFTDGAVERILERRLPVRPDPVGRPACGCAAGLCASAVSAEDVAEA